MVKLEEFDGPRIVLPAAAPVTPGNARDRSSKRSKNCWRAAASGYLIGGSCTLAVSTLPGSNPRSTRCACTRLVSDRLAAETTIVAIVICETTSAHLKRDDSPPRPAPFTPLATTPTTSAPAAFQLGRTPKSTPVRAAMPSPTASIGPSSETSLSHDNVGGATLTSN